MMERFAINILHKRIYKICRLCGVDQPHKIPIIDGAETILVGDEDEEASLAKKIEECVGIQVHKDDKMPQNICALCVDKINDFYEYRLMCAATNLQTRSILNLNLVEPSRKLLNFGEVTKVEDVKKEDVKKVVEVATSSSNTIIPTGGKKGKKKRGPPSPSPSPAPPTTRIKAPVDVKDEPVPAIPVKALTKKERMKQMQLQKEKDEKKKKDDEKKKKEDEKKDKKDDKLKKEKVEAKAPEVNEQKHTRSKRKEPSPPKEVAETVEQTVPPPKKIKFEHPCSYCTDEFKTETELAAHLVAKHTPSVRKFGCGSCRETFETVLESKDHNLWHQLTRTLYTCFKCKRKYDKNLALVKHMSLNACGRVARGRPPALHPDVQCRLCSKKFKTQNLYEWHGCFLKPKCNCPKCGKYFVKRQILIRHYMMYCTGTLPPPEPVIIPKVEPVDPAEKPAAATTVATEKPDRRKRRVAFAEPELPKEEREIPFPPPLEPEAAASSPAPTPTPAPSGSKKKNKKDSTPNVTIKPVPPPPAQTEKITSLLTSGAKLDRDSDIATINNLLSSVTEAIASISEAKAKKKKKKKDKIKDKAETETESPTVEEQKKDPAPPEPKEPTPPPPAVEEKTEEDLEAYALAQEVGEMTLDQQLAFCSGKLPLVVLAKTTFKQEYTEIDTEPSQMQEPMAENGEDDGYDDAGNDYSGFQDDDDNEEEPAEQEEAPVAEQNQQTEELEFPRPIKQEVEPEEPTIAPETPQQEEAQSAQQEETDSPRLEATQTPQPEEQTQPTVVAAPKPAKEPESLFNEQLAITIKKEPGLEEEPQQPAAKRKRPESRASAAPSPASPVSSSRSAPQESPKLILKINKGMLNSATESTRAIKTIVLDDDDDDEGEQRIPEPSEASKKTKVYKKPDFLAVKIKQEKVDPAYEHVETPTVVGQVELPGGIRIKQERLDPDEEPAQQYEEEEQAPPPQKKSRLSHKDKPASPIVAFDGVRIKQEKPDALQPDVEMPSSIPAPEDPKPAQEKKKKSKGKINPFALLRQKMAAEAAAKAAAGSAPPQAPSPLPVITNVVGNAPTTSTSSASSSGENTPLAESDSESDRRVPVIAQVASIAAEKVSAPAFPIAIKQEPVDEPEEELQQEQPHAEAEEESPENDFPMPIKQEIPDEPPKVSEESPSEAEESDFPVPIKEEQLESQPESSESVTRQQDEEPVAKDVAEEKEPETPSSAEEEQSDEKGDDEGEADDHKSVPSSVQEEEQVEDDEHDDDEKETVQKSEDEKEEIPAEAATKDQNEEEEEDDDGEEGEESAGAAVDDTVVPSEEYKADYKEEDEDDGEEEEDEESSSPAVEEKKDSIVPSEEEEEANQNEEDEDDGEEEENEESSSPAEEEKKVLPKADEEQNEKDEDNDEEEQEESPSLAEVEEKAEPHLENEEQGNSEDQNDADEHEDEEEAKESPSDVVKENVDSPPEENKIYDQNDQDKEDEHEEKEQNVAGQRVETEEVTEQKEENNIDETIERSDVPDQNEPQLNDEPENSTSPISDIPMDDYDQNSLGQENLPFKPQEPQQESIAVVEPPAVTEAPKPSSTSDECADARLESQLEELQNLLTGGLKPLPDPTQLAQDSSFVPSSSVQNMVQSSSTGLSSVENNVGISGLDDDLDSLLNNKLEEIKAAQPLSSLPPQDDLNMVIERELLHEMMPIGSEISDNGNNSLLGVGQDLLLDGSGNSSQQSS